MNIINADSFKKRTGKLTEIPILYLRQNGLVINKYAAEQAQIAINEGRFYATFATDESEQLHVCFNADQSEASCLFKSNKKDYMCYNTGLFEHFRKLTGSEKKSVPCKIQVQAKTDDGWYPVITTFWKTQK